MIAREDFAGGGGGASAVLERPEELASAPIVQTLYVPTGPMQETAAFRLTKRIADITIASCAMVVALPVAVVLSAIIYATDRGPVIYKQMRVGRYGVQFPFYKFRSMRVDADEIRKQLLSQSDAEGGAFKMKNDPRVTKIGRFMRKYSMDEIPQFVCVLAGHMSIVGPRPDLIEEANYEPNHRVRLMVKPGLLCLREINGRSNISRAEWMRLDVEYIENRSLWLDLKIVLKAIPAIIKAEGAY